MVGALVGAVPVTAAAVLFNGTVGKPETEEVPLPEGGVAGPVEIGVGVVKGTFVGPVDVIDLFELGAGEPETSGVEEV